MGAALAYYAVFSLAPLLVIVIAIAGLAFGEAAAQGQIVERIQGVVGPDGARTIQTMLANAWNPTSGIVATALSLTVLVLAACGLVTELKDSLNTIWGATPPSGRGLVGPFIDYGLSLAIVLGIGFLLMVSFILSAALAAMVAFFADMLPGRAYTAHALQALNLLLSVGVVALLFASIYKLLPDVAVPWRVAGVGGLVTAVLFTVGQYVVALYLATRSVASPYGAAGSLVVVLVWVYYSAQILFLGAEFTQVYARRRAPTVV
jgi:membrane protein